MFLPTIILDVNIKQNQYCIFKVNNSLYTQATCMLSGFASVMSNSLQPYGL